MLSCMMRTARLLTVSGGLPNPRGVFTQPQEQEGVCIGDLHPGGLPNPGGSAQLRGVCPTLGVCIQGGSAQLREGVCIWGGLHPGGSAQPLGHLPNPRGSASRGGLPNPGGVCIWRGLHPGGLGRPPSRSL